MAKWHVVVSDPERELASARLRGHSHAVREIGAIHAADVDEACPLGRPNCRHCGDPTHAEACAAAGHCPDCGTKHGIAPDAVLAANGYKLVSAEES